jgi:hypothetical protein
MTDLDIIAQLNTKMQQLSPQLVTEVADYVDFLLQKYQISEWNKREATERKIADIFPRKLENLKPFARDEIYE